MDEDTGARRAPVGEEPGSGTRTPEEIRADIEQTRREVGDTVEALAEKTDVKAQAQQRVDDAKAQAQARVDEVKANVMAHTPESGQDLAAKVRRNPLPLVAAGALVAAYLLGRRSARP